jgi:hypothetical protein
MIQKAYEQLKTPKTLSEVHSRFNEIGIKWNLAQVQLFLEMDKKIVKENGLYSTNVGGLDHKVLGVLDQLFSDKPKIPVSKIMEQIPFTIGKPELLAIVEKSDSYYSPNGVIISKK